MSGRKVIFPSLKNILKQQPTVTRVCLKCSKEFQSRGNHNRICTKCDSENIRFGKRVGEGGGARKTRGVSDYAN